MTKQKEQQIYIVEYIDSNIMNDQSSEIVEPTVIKAVGFVLKHDPNFITLARELIDDEYRGQVSIPADSLIQVIKLQEK